MKSNYSDRIVEVMNKDENNYIFIPGNVPSLKNGKEWTGQFLVYSDTVVKYLKSHNIKSFNSSRRNGKIPHVIHFKRLGLENTFEQKCEEIKQVLSTLEPPYKFNFHFVRKSKHKFDFGNAFELLADLFTSYGIIEDDNMDIFHPGILYIDGQGYSYDKNNPGVYIEITN